MEMNDFIVYIVEGLITIGLFIFGFMLKQINDKFDGITIANDQLSKDIHNLDKRVTRIETVNDERLKLIDEIHSDQRELTNALKEFRSDYDKRMTDLFEKYEFKKKQ